MTELWALPRSSTEVLQCFDLYSSRGKSCRRVDHVGKQSDYPNGAGGVQHEGVKGNPLRLGCIAQIMGAWGYGEEPSD